MTSPYNNAATNLAFGTKHARNTAIDNKTNRWLSLKHGGLSSSREWREEGKEVTDMTAENSVVAIFKNHQDAESAVKELQKSGFNMKQLSIIGKDYHTEEHAVGYYNTGDRMWYWGKFGAFWGGIWGLLIGWGFFWIPTIGPMLVAGPLVNAIVGGLEGVAIGGGLSALGAGLYSLGIPKDSVITYETAIRADKFILVAHGTHNDVEHARKILETTSSERIDVYEPESANV